MAKNEDNWEEIGTPETWNFVEEGKDAELIGTFTRKEEGVGENKSNIYTLKQEDGEIISFWGNTILDIRLRDVVIGEEIKIVYKGKATSEKSGRTYHDFVVSHRPQAFKEISDEEIDLDEILLED